MTTEESRGSAAPVTLWWGAMQPTWSRTLPEMPSDCLTRAQTHMNMIRLGLGDMSKREQDRVVLGFCAIAVFGTSVTWALQHLRSWGEAAFEGWYAPWQAELKADPLCRFFHKMRTDIINGGVPNIAYVLHAAGVNVPKPGTLRVTDRQLPTEHRGKPIADTSTLNLCRLYVAYLEGLVTSAAEVVWPVQDRWMAEQQAATSSPPSPGRYSPEGRTSEPQPDPI
jgi:hypothetical protein